MTGYIDDVSSTAAFLLLLCAVGVAVFRRWFPSAIRVLSAAAVGVAATISFLLAVFLVALATSPSPPLARFDPFCTISAALTFLPAQLLWVRSIRRRIVAVAVLACLSLFPTILAMGLLRSTGAPFYFPHL
jgi:hypothetical protein